MYSVIIFRLHTLKSTAIILTVVILDFNTLSSTNLQNLTPERYDERSRHFYGSPLAGGGGGGNFGILRV